LALPNVVGRLRHLLHGPPRRKSSLCRTEDDQTRTQKYAAFRVERTRRGFANAREGEKGRRGEGEKARMEHLRTNWMRAVLDTFKVKVSSIFQKFPNEETYKYGILSATDSC
jgi:hypothetical protein